ncbi:BrnT family toxin [Thioalkalivibrio sp. XN8]|uniref:BrnT family toxin n=1 Tax=Thioalkalivibrio sp. XN8 TaxID=2712863 RepID=UPI0013ECD16E|nr:BrnT family toxin [Thioalkalivibrio sp. XN8]NGP52497.1 BrnT family toxin [Thioalkalivibrio sp. XN8]
MDYEWDPAKGRRNAAKHGVDFADAVIALSDDSAVTIPDPDAEDEDRFVSLGMDPIGRVLVTVFTHRGERIRIISSRKASRGERRQYEEHR